MSETRTRRRGDEVRAPRLRDAGLSLSEVLVATMVMGIMVASLAMATRVILQQADNTKGRANNARSEQNVGMFMPTDLSSAETVNVTPGGLPCGPDPACPPGADLGGSNALMLTWSGQEFDVDSNSVLPTVTNVSYRVVKIGEEFRLLRMECTGFVNDELTCTTRTVLRNLESPPPGVEWFPGTTTPSWVINVTQAAAADAIDGTPPDPGYNNKNAQRVVVTINGGGDISGAGGGRNQISLSAGGTNRQTNLSTDDLAGAPTFTAARSRCGGNFGLIVDRSGSIGGDMPAVRDGIIGFIDRFDGTPVKLQVVTFSSTASTLGSGSSWTKYYDMLIEADVAELQGLVGGLTASGGTNWEDGIFRMLKNSDGSVQAQLPNTIIFFTDGIPTRSRIDYTSASAPVVAHPDDDGFPASNGSSFSQIGWNRGERILRDRGSISVIGVYVNSDPTETSSWLTRSGYHLDHARRGNVVYQQGGTTYERASNLTFQVSLDTDLVFERLSGTWQSTTRALFLANNTNNTESDGWRTRTTGSISSSNSNWTTMTEAQYNAANSTNAISDGFRTRLSSSATGWVSVSSSLYGLSNTTSDSSDGWRVGAIGWSDVTETLYNANNTVAGESDGWRTVTSGSSSSWTAVAESLYQLSNTTPDDTDGWRVTRDYSEPYDFFDTTPSPMFNYATIGNLVVGNISGVEGGFVEATPRGGPYTNAAASDLFVLPNYTNFGSALASVALDQCGGTVTVQTRVGSSPAQDPFTYENTNTNEIVQTSAAYRSGTFDIALPGGGATTVVISPQEFTNLVRYSPAGWSCKSGGVAYPFTTIPVPDHAPWTAIQLSVNPNQAVSCVQQVILT